MKEFNVCIVGGGSTYTLGFLKSFVRLREEFPLKKLVLFDIDAQRQEPIGKYGKILFRERFPELDFSYTTDIEEAYTGMDFVFMQMRAGGLDMRAKDEHIPLSMGMIGQETCGAGGMAYGLRSCVDMIKAVHDIRRLAPDAWILNYSNPAAIVAEALRREFPGDKRLLNICDQPENVVRSCSRLLGCSWEDLDPVYFGLNHYGWFTNMYDLKTGEDLMPEIRKRIKENGFLPQDAEQRDQSWLDTYGMVQTIMNDFPDYLPNTYDQYYLYPEYKAKPKAAKVQKSQLVAPVSGKVLPMSEAKDENFAAGILGDGVVIQPTEDLIVAPCDGVITHCSEDNKHAIGLKSAAGQEILIHVGVDTVGLKGEGFEQLKKEGDTVRAGAPILRFSRSFIESKNLCADVMVILIEDDEPVPAQFVTGDTAEAGKTVVAHIG